MKATIDTYENCYRITVTLPDALTSVEGGAEVIEHKDKDGNVTSREAVWTLPPDVDPKAWAKQEILPLIEASSPGDGIEPEDAQPVKTSTVTL
jgi:hypothetical protein